jgi:hypothetical protein
LINGIEWKETDGAIFTGALYCWPFFNGNSIQCVTWTEKLYKARVLVKAKTDLFANRKRKQWWRGLQSFFIQCARRSCSNTFRLIAFWTITRAPFTESLKVDFKGLKTGEVIRLVPCVIVKVLHHRANCLKTYFVEVPGFEFRSRHQQSCLRSVTSMKTDGILLALSWRWRRYVPPKRGLLVFNGLYGFILQKTVIFITTGLRTLNPILDNSSK